MITIMLVCLLVLMVAIGIGAIVMIASAAGAVLTVFWPFVLLLVLDILLVVFLVKKIFGKKGE